VTGVPRSGEFFPAVPASSYPVGSTPQCAAFGAGGAGVPGLHGLGPRPPTSPTWTARGAMLTWSARWGADDPGARPHPEVTEGGGRRAAARGNRSFGTATPRRGGAGRGDRGQGPPVEKIRLVNSGTEADDCRQCGWPGHSPAGRIVVKFAGCYHGHVDALLAAAGSGGGYFRAPGLTWGSPEASAGGHGSCSRTTTPWRSARPSWTMAPRIACVITEACPAKHGKWWPPAGGFNEMLAETLP